MHQSPRQVRFSLKSLASHAAAQLLLVRPKLLVAPLLCSRGGGRSALLKALQSALPGSLESLLLLLLLEAFAKSAPCDFPVLLSGARILAADFDTGGNVFQIHTGGGLVDFLTATS